MYWSCPTEITLLAVAGHGDRWGEPGTPFEGVARKDQLAVHDWSGTASATLDRGRRLPVFTSIELVVKVAAAAGDEDRARRVLDTAERSCIIANALNVPVTLSSRTSVVPSHPSSA